MWEKTKKGQMSIEAGIGNVIMFAVLVITLVVAAIVVAGVGAGQTANSAGSNITIQGQQGLINLSNLTPQIGTIIGAVIILTVLIGGLGFLYMRRQA